ncbi:hypothetical protein [Sphaerisporangium sp. NPDC051011]|uniref:hypothetical protein n=1 Tax=Sphaerisporangium sp. NPDC051011 TaxID=3155792 RepID=UPI0033FDF907
MLLSFQDAGLAQIVNDHLSIMRVWPLAVVEVMMIMKLLQLAAPTLVNALGLGIKITPPRVEGPDGLISVAYGSVVIMALAKGEFGEAVSRPYDKPAEVWALEVADMIVDGQSGLGMAA